MRMFSVRDVAFARRASIHHPVVDTATVASD
jgi:hypothetical protein